MRSGEEIRVELLERLRVSAVLFPALAWIAFLWERFTGLTFEMSRNPTRLGSYASPVHVHRVFGLAIAVTLIFVPLGLWGHLMLRSRKRG